MVVQVIWDPLDDFESNAAHILEGGVSLEEVEEVIGDPDAWVSLGRSRSSGYPMLFGRTRTGRSLAVVFDLIDDDPRIVYPITAFEPTTQ